MDGSDSPAESLFRSLRKQSPRPHLLQQPEALLPRPLSWGTPESFAHVANIIQTMMNSCVPPVGGSASAEQEPGRLSSCAQDEQAHVDVHSGR